MASRYFFSTETVASMSYEQIKGLSPKELRTSTRQLLDVVKKRYKSGSEKWGDVAALNVWSEYTHATGKVSIRGMTEAELIKTLQKAQTFYQSKTSTEKGRSELKTKFEKTMGQELSVDQFKRLWSIYNKVEELYKNNGEKGTTNFNIGFFKANYKTFLKDIVNEVKQGNAEEYLKNAEEKLEVIYRQEQDINRKEAVYNDETARAIAGLDPEGLFFTEEDLQT